MRIPDRAVSCPVSSSDLRFMVPDPDLSTLPARRLERRLEAAPATTRPACLPDHHNCNFTHDMTSFRVSELQDSSSSITSLGSIQLEVAPNISVCLCSQSLFPFPYLEAQPVAESSYDQRRRSSNVVRFLCC